MNSPRGTAVLTGGLGYVGRHVADCLVAHGWDLVLLLRPGARARLQSSLRGSRCVDYDGCLASLDALELDDSRTVFFHLAASTETHDEFGSCDALLDSNIRFGVHLLSYMARHRQGKLISAESYWQFDHDGVLGGNCLYAASKSAFSLLLEYAGRSAARVIALVLYDVYGPDDERGKLLNLLVRHTMTRQPIDLTPGEQIVDYVHVKDVALAFVMAGQALLQQPPGPGFQRHTVRSMQSARLRDVVETVGRVLGQVPPARWGAKPYPPHQVMRPWLPPDERQLPGWAPSIPLEVGLRDLIPDA